MDTTMTVGMASEGRSKFPNKNVHMFVCKEHSIRICEFCWKTSCRLSMLCMDANE